MTEDSTHPCRRRLSKSERVQLIVDEAVRFFAEVGFEGQTRALAQRMGVTQPLIYRYFPDKDALIERVYQEVFVGHWNSEWEALLRDRSRPLVERIHDFYGQYIERAISYERVRLLMYGGLKDREIGRRYLAFLEHHVFVPLARELQAEVGRPDREPAADAMELVAGLHGAISYLGIRRHIFSAPTPGDFDGSLRQLVGAFILGAPAALKTLSA